MTGQVDALQQALAAEHAAIWAYGEIGARSADARVAEVGAVQQTHRVRRDATEVVLTGLGATPVAAKSSYSLPVAVTDATTALTVAATVEDGVAASWRYLLGETDDAGVRALAARGLKAAAVRAMRWRSLAPAGTPTTRAFPGL